MKIAFHPFPDSFLCLQNTNLQGCQHRDLQKENTYLSVQKNSQSGVEKINTGELETEWQEVGGADSMTD